MKNNTSNHEKNGPESLKLCWGYRPHARLPNDAPTTPSSRGLEDFFRDFTHHRRNLLRDLVYTEPDLAEIRANKKAYVFLYGVLGCIFSASYAYFNGTITTSRKDSRYLSKTTGLISVGNDISQLFVSVVLSYYAGRGHRPAMDRIRDLYW